MTMIITTIMAIINSTMRAAMEMIPLFIISIRHTLPIIRMSTSMSMHMNMHMHMSMHMDMDMIIITRSTRPNSIPPKIGNTFQIM